MRQAKSHAMDSLSGLVRQYLQQMDIDTNKLHPISEDIDSLLRTGKRHSQANWAAHMTPAVSQLAALGQLVAALHQGNLLSVELYPELHQIEKTIFDFFCPLFGQKTGHATHGGSYGNLDALWQARKKFGNVSNRVYANEYCHYSVAKACDILGLQLQLIPANSSQQMDVEALKRACSQKTPMAIVATAGTTSSGQLDDINAIKAIIEHSASWLHIDAAWGGFLSLIDNSPLTAKVLGQADSVCFDPHKSLGQPRPCGLLMYQQSLKASAVSAHYLAHTPRDTLTGSYGAELLLPLWLTIKTLEKTGLAHQLETQLEQAGQFAEALNEWSGWWVQNSPTGVVCFEAPQHKNLSSLVESGIFSITELAGRSVYRAVFASPSTRHEALINDLAPFR